MVTQNQGQNKLIDNKRNQRDMPRLLYRFSNHALMLGAGPRCTSGNDFSPIREKPIAIFRLRHLFIVDACHLIDAEHTHFASGFTELIRFATRGTGSRSASRHQKFLSSESGADNLLFILFN